MAQNPFTFYVQENTVPIDLSRPESAESFNPSKVPLKPNPKDTDLHSTFVHPNDNVEEVKPIHISRSPLKPMDSNSLPSKKHKLNRQEAMPDDHVEPFSKDSVTCEDCQIQLTSITSLREHRLGRRHMMVINAKRMKKPTNSCDLDAIENEQDRKSPSFPVIDKTSHLQTEGSNAHGLNDMFIQTGKIAKNCSGFSPLIPYFCHLCNVPITNHAAIENHVKGRRHRAMLRNKDYDPSQSLQTAESSTDLGSPVYPLAPSRSESEAPAVVTNECKQIFVDNWVSDVSQKVSDSAVVTFAETSMDHQLNTRAVLRRVCLTQILSLMQSNEQRMLPQTPSPSISEEQLLSMINAKCIDMLLAYDTPRNEDQSSATGTLPPDRIMQNMLLLSWCQQLAFLQS